MTFHENEPAASRPKSTDHEAKADASAPQDAVRRPAQAQSGKTVLLNWCIMLCGFAGIAALAYWLL